jgi:hypothetical protein
MWALHGDELLPGEGSFPDHKLLSTRQGALVRLNQMQYVEFRAADGRLRVVSADAERRRVTAHRASAGRDTNMPYATGYVERRRKHGYMALAPDINHGGTIYLFKPDFTT